VRLAAAARSAFFALLAVFGASALAAGQPVKLLMSATTDGNGRVMPLSEETRALLQAIEQASGLSFEVQPLPWQRALRLVAQGEGLLFGATLTAERQKTLAFSEPLYRESVWLVTRCDRTFDYRQLSQLEGKTLGAVRGGVIGPDVDAAVRAGRFRLDYETGDSRARFEKLLLGRTDALLIYSRWPAADVERALQERYGMLGARESDAMQRHPFCVMPRPVFSDDVRIAAAIGHHAEVLRRINRALAQGRASGRLNPVMPEASQGRREP
jgi:polar amino acid transport system substrate-binding protein